MNLLSHYAAACLLLCASSVAKPAVEPVRLEPLGLMMIYPDMEEYMWNGMKPGTSLGFVCMTGREGLDVLPSDAAREGKCDLKAVDSSGRVLGAVELKMDCDDDKEEGRLYGYLQMPQCPAPGASWVEVRGNLPLFLTSEKAESEQVPLVCKEGETLSAGGFDVTVKSVKKVPSSVMYPDVCSGPGGWATYGPECYEVVLSFRTEKPLAWTGFKFFNARKEPLRDYLSPYDYCDVKKDEGRWKVRESPYRRTYYFVDEPKGLLMAVEYKKKKEVAVPVSLRFDIQAAEQHNMASARRGSTEKGTGLSFDEQKPMLVSVQRQSVDRETGKIRPDPETDVGFVCLLDNKDATLGLPNIPSSGYEDIVEAIQLKCVDSTGTDLGDMKAASLHDWKQGKSVSGTVTYGALPAPGAKWLHITGKVRVYHYAKKTESVWVRGEMRNGACFDVEGIQVKVAYKKPNWDDGGLNHELTLFYDSKEPRCVLDVKFRDAATGREWKAGGPDDKDCDFQPCSTWSASRMRTEGSQGFVFRRKPEVLEVALVYWKDVSSPWLPIDIRLDLGAPQVKKQQAEAGK